MGLEQQCYTLFIAHVSFVSLEKYNFHGEPFFKKEIEIVAKGNDKKNKKKEKNEKENWTEERKEQEA